MYQPLNSFLKLHEETLHFIFLLGFFDSGGLEILTKTFVKIWSIQMSQNVILTGETVIVVWFSRLVPFRARFSVREIVKTARKYRLPGWL